MSADALAQLRTLMSPDGGLVSRVRRLPTAAGDPEYTIMTASLGDPGEVVPTIRRAARANVTRNQLDGAGGAVDADRATMLALAEALERYSSCVIRDEDVRWASAEDLGEDALDLDTVPRCSARELAHPRCLVSPPDRRARMRWVRGTSLLDGRTVWVPAVMVYLHVPPASPAERFTLPISTGCAAHVDLASAILNALAEVIERDAIALTWLQRLSLPRLELDGLPTVAAEYLERQGRGGVTTHLFDATTDLGVPTVYGVETAPHNRRLATMVMCATALDPVDAVIKVLREAASCRIALSNAPSPPARIDDFLRVFDGAVYMGHADRREAFSFLLETPHRRRLSDVRSLATGDPVRDLARAAERLRDRGMEAVVVDLTSDEARRAGFRVVRVVVPALQPLSFAHRSRYLAHPRLYDAPARMGHVVRTEEEINPWPQPFA